MFEFAQVIHVYPQYRTAEVVMTNTAQRFQNVTFLGDYVTTNSGSWRSHAMLRPPAEEDAGGLMPDDKDRTVLAACIMIGGRPLIIGFMAHPLTQIAFLPDEQNREVSRHPSGTLHTIDKAGNFEFQHTGGAFIRIARDSATAVADRHEDLTPLCANENWELPFNEPVTLTICTGDQGGAAFKMRVRPNGDTDIMSAGNLNIRYQGNAHIDVGGSAEIHVAGNMTASVGGNLDARAGASVTATAGGNAHLLAMGSGYMASVGPATVGSQDRLTLEAPRIEMVCDFLDVTAGSAGIQAGSLGISGAVGIEGSLAVSGSSSVVGEFAVEGAIGLAGTFGMEGLMGVVG